MGEGGEEREFEGVLGWGQGGEGGQDGAGGEDEGEHWCGEGWRLWCRVGEGEEKKKSRRR